MVCFKIRQKYEKNPYRNEKFLVGVDFFGGGLKHVLVCSRIEQVEVTAFSDDAIDQHPVELDVALAEVFVVACKLVVFVFRVELPPFGELLHHIVKEADIKASFLCLMVGFFCTCWNTRYCTWPQALIFSK